MTDGSLGPQSGSSSAPRPASAAPAHHGWGSAGSELKTLQERARELEADSDASSEELDEEDGIRPPSGMDRDVAWAHRPRLETDTYPGGSRAARKGAKARAALAAAKAFEAEIAEEEYESDSEYEPEV